MRRDVIHRRMQPAKNSNTRRQPDEKSLKGGGEKVISKRGQRGVKKEGRLKGRTRRGGELVSTNSEPLLYEIALNKAIGMKKELQEAGRLRS